MPGLIPYKLPVFPRSVASPMDHGIRSIVALYVRLGDATALSNLRAHRLALLARCGDTEYFSFASWRDCYQQDLRLIDAGLDKLVSSAQLQGYVDCWHPLRIAGWVRYVNYPDIPVRLALFFDGELAGRVVADRYRTIWRKPGSVTAVMASNSSRLPTRSFRSSLLSSKR